MNTDYTYLDIFSLKGMEGSRAPTRGEIIVHMYKHGVPEDLYAPRIHKAQLYRRTQFVCAAIAIAIFMVGAFFTYYLFSRKSAREALPLAIILYGSAGCAALLACGILEKIRDNFLNTPLTAPMLVRELGCIKAAVHFQQHDYDEALRNACNARIKDLEPAVTAEYKCLYESFEDD